MPPSAVRSDNEAKLHSLVRWQSEFRIKLKAFVIISDIDKKPIVSNKQIIPPGVEPWTAALQLITKKGLLERVALHSIYPKQYRKLFEVKRLRRRHCH